MNAWATRRSFATWPGSGRELVERAARSARRRGAAPRARIRRRRASDRAPSGTLRRRRGPALALRRRDAEAAAAGSRRRLEVEQDDLRRARAFGVNGRADWPTSIMSPLICPALNGCRRRPRAARVSLDHDQASARGRRRNCRYIEKRATTSSALRASRRCDSRTSCSLRSAWRTSRSSSPSSCVAWLHLLQPRLGTSARARAPTARGRARSGSGACRGRRTPRRPSRASRARVPRGVVRLQRLLPQRAEHRLDQQVAQREHARSSRPCRGDDEALPPIDAVSSPSPPKSATTTGSSAATSRRASRRRRPPPSPRTARRCAGAPCRGARPRSPP